MALEEAIVVLAVHNRDRYLDALGHRESALLGMEGRSHGNINHLQAGALQIAVGIVVEFFVLLLQIILQGGLYPAQVAVDHLVACADQNAQHGILTQLEVE